MHSFIHSFIHTLVRGAGRPVGVGRPPQSSFISRLLFVVVNSHPPTLSSTRPAFLADDVRNAVRGKGGDGDDREDDAPLTVPWLPRPRAEEEQDTLEAVSTAAHSVVMMRHGESLFNKHNVFTGWCDVPLTEDGRREATHAGHILASHGLEAHSSTFEQLQPSPE